MRIVPLVLLVSVACRYDLDHAKPDATDLNARLCPVSENVQSCLDATGRADFTYVATQIMQPKCALDNSCHQGESNNVAGYLNLGNMGSAYTTLVGKASQVDPTRTLVVPGDPAKSFLLVMTGQIKPADADPALTGGIPSQDSHGNAVGLMPQGDIEPLCCQKLDAIAAWIQAGAPMQ
ncbi:MAG TPA: hypothetical protein VGG28_05915 [Kofleriaceae bacterium]